MFISKLSLCLCEDFIDLSVRVRASMSGSPGGRGAEDVELLDDGSSAAGGLAEPAENPISGLMNCASHVVEHRVRGEYVKTFRLLGSKLPTLGLLIMIMLIMLIMTASQCKWAPQYYFAF